MNFPFHIKVSHKLQLIITPVSATGIPGELDTVSKNKNLRGIMRISPYLILTTFVASVYGYGYKYNRDPYTGECSLQMTLPGGNVEPYSPGRYGYDSNSYHRITTPRPGSYTTSHTPYAAGGYGRNPRRYPTSPTATNNHRQSYSGNPHYNSYGRNYAAYNSPASGTDYHSRNYDSGHNAGGLPTTRSPSTSQAAAHEYGGNAAYGAGSRAVGYRGGAGSGRNYGSNDGDYSSGYTG